jgi:hypothetical protein
LDPPVLNRTRRSAAPFPRAPHFNDRSTFFLCQLKQILVLFTHESTPHAASFGSLKLSPLRVNYEWSRHPSSLAITPGSQWRLGTCKFQDTRELNTKVAMKYSKRVAPGIILDSPAPLGLKHCPYKSWRVTSRIESDVSIRFRHSFQVPAMPPPKYLTLRSGHPEQSQTMLLPTH